MERQIKLKYGTLLLCTDLENCNKEHIEVDHGGSPEYIESHHYGCDCEDCVWFYRSLK